MIVFVNEIATAEVELTEVNGRKAVISGKCWNEKNAVCFSLNIHVDLIIYLYLKVFYLFFMLQYSVIPITKYFIMEFLKLLFQTPFPLCKLQHFHLTSSPPA